MGIVWLGFQVFKKLLKSLLAVLQVDFAHKLVEICVVIGDGEFFDCEFAQVQVADGEFNILEILFRQLDYQEMGEVVNFLGGFVGLLGFAVLAMFNFVSSVEALPDF